jgi:hypothetical protein
MESNEELRSSCGSPMRVASPVSRFDSMNLVLAPDETALIFTNKKDGSLWLLNFIPYTVPNKNNITIDTGKDE